MFEHLHSIYAAFDGRIKADHFRRQVMSVTSVWETWMIFNNQNVEAWVKTFLGRTAEEGGDEEVEDADVVEEVVEKKGKWKSVTETSGKEARDVGGYTSPVPSAEEGEDVDGVAMEEKEDVDGEPMEDEDVDGMPMEDDDVDGEPMEEDDVDGVPMEEAAADSVSVRELTPQPPVEPKPSDPRPAKRQRMKAVDMFAD